MSLELRLTLVVAVAGNGVIGRDGGLPWRLPDDLKHFRRLTIGKTMLMGRNTYESLGKPLQGRENWVLSRNPGLQLEGARVFTTLSSVLREFQGDELMVIGGAQLYRETLPIAARIELTEVDAAIEGDTYFPPYDHGEWTETARESHPADEKHAFGFSFVSLIRA